MSTLSQADAARVNAIHAEREAIYRRDRGCGLDAADEVKLDRLMSELQAIRDRQYGIVRQPMQFAPMPTIEYRKKRKPKRKLPRNACRCDLERFKDELCPGAFSLDGRLAPNITAPRPPRFRWPKRAAELCLTCQVPRLLDMAERLGKDVVDVLKGEYGIDATDDDRACLEELSRARHSGGVFRHDAAHADLQAAVVRVHPGETGVPGANRPTREPVDESAALAERVRAGSGS